jgi:hypothetical protein
MFGMSYKKEVQEGIKKRVDEWIAVDGDLTIEAKDDLSFIGTRFFSGLFGSPEPGLKALQEVLTNSNLSRNNRMIFLSFIAPQLRTMWSRGNNYNVNNKHYAIVQFAKLGASLPVVYDVRTGNTPGCIFLPTYPWSDPLKWEVHPTAYFHPDFARCDQPALDCVAFVSWVFWALDIYGGPLNENTEDARGLGRVYPSPRGGAGGGVGNAFRSTLLEPVPDGYAFPGDLIFFTGHIGIVTNTDQGRVTEITHSSPKYSSYKSGPKIESPYTATKQFEYLLRLTKEAVIFFAEKDPKIVHKDSPYLLARLVD